MSILLLRIEITAIDLKFKCSAQSLKMHINFKRVFVMSLWGVEKLEDQRKDNWAEHIEHHGNKWRQNDEEEHRRPAVKTADTACPRSNLSVDEHGPLTNKQVKNN